MIDFTLAELLTGLDLETALDAPADLKSVSVPDASDKAVAPPETAEAEKPER